jgi:uncharacterized protein with von Willebrand factor type A (vWA) domain
MSGFLSISEETKSGATSLDKLKSLIDQKCLLLEEKSAQIKLKNDEITELKSTLKGLQSTVATMRDVRTRLYETSSACLDLQFRSEDEIDQNHRQKLERLDAEYKELCRGQTHLREEYKRLCGGEAHLHEEYKELCRCKALLQEEHNRLCERSHAERKQERGSLILPLTTDS